MESKNSSLAILHEPFVAGMDENLSPIMQRLWKLEGGAIYFCRSGWAHVTIDLKDYEIVENTQIVLLPGTIIRINGNSSDFTASFFGFPKEMFREACLRFEPIFFRFIKEKPCYTLKDESTGAINGLMRATTAIYNDRENRFRNQIAKNHLQSFMLDIYDKCYRYFDRQEIEGGSRQDEIFKNFIALVHENCISQREVTFYASKLCIHQIPDRYLQKRDGRGCQKDYRRLCHPGDKSVASIHRTDDSGNSRPTWFSRSVVFRKVLQTARGDVAERVSE